MTEAEAWRRLALRWERARPKSMFMQSFYCLQRSWARGLCYAVTTMCVSARVRTQMQDRLRSFGGRRRRKGFWWPTTTAEGAQDRAMACAWLAAMAEEP